MSIANNHLSKHGRFGDTEIAKTSTGDLWHVNKHEKKLIDNYQNKIQKMIENSKHPCDRCNQQFIDTNMS